MQRNVPAEKARADDVIRDARPGPSRTEPERKRNHARRNHQGKARG